MKIKYFFAIAVLVTTFLGFGLPASTVNALACSLTDATCLTNLLAQLQTQMPTVCPTGQAITAACLNLQIDILQTQLLLQNQDTTPPTAWCHTFNINLGTINSGSDEVGQLHIALRKENISYGRDTGNTYAGGTTFAVVQFQRKYRIYQNGYVGPVTRAKLNALYGCSTTTTPSITVTSPNGGEVYDIAQTKTIDIKYSTANLGTGKIAINLVSISDLGVEGTSYSLATNLSPTGTFTWNLWNFNLGNFRYPLGNYKIAISSGSVTDSSNSYFSITNIAQPSITVTSPNGGESWALGSTHNITWTSTGMAGYGGVPTGIVMITLIGAPGSISPAIIAASVPATDGSYSWTIPSNTTFPAGSQYKINVGWANVQDSSNNVFSIVAPSTQPSITVTSPNGGEQWQIGSKYNITWTSTGIDTINIGLVLPNSDGPIIANNISASAGNYSWTIPSSVAPGSNYRVVIRRPAPDYTLLEQSDSYFSIVAPTASASAVLSLAATPTSRYDFNATTPANSVASGVITFKIMANGGDLSPITSDNVTVQVCGSSGCTSTGVAKDVVAIPDGIIRDGEQAIVTVNAAYTGGSGFIYFKISEIDWTMGGVTTRQTSGLAVYRTPAVNASGIVVPPITVISPNGGETYDISQTKTIAVKYSTANLGTEKISIDLVSANESTLGTTYSLALNQTPTGAFVWNLWNFNSSNFKYPLGKYKIVVKSASANDSSDGYFTMTNSTLGLSVQQSSLASLSTTLANLFLQIQAMLNK